MPENERRWYYIWATSEDEAPVARKVESPEAALKSFKQYRDFPSHTTFVVVAEEDCTLWRYRLTKDED